MLVYTPSKHDVDQMLVQFSPTVCDAGSASNQHWFNASRLLSTKHLYNIWTMLSQRRRRWACVVQMLYKCFVFAGNSSWSGDDYKPTLTQCLLKVGPASPVLASRHSVLISTFMLRVHACWRNCHDALNQSWVNVGPPSVTLAHIQRGVKHDTVTQY